MLLFFTSNLQKRYRNDAWLALAYPRGHVVTFRYHDRIVDPKVLNWPSSTDGSVQVPPGIRQATIVYADYISGDFDFYPLRSASLVRMWKRGTGHYTALRLEDYVSYATDSQPNKFRDAIHKVEYRPRIQTEEKQTYGEGHFLRLTDNPLLRPQTSYAGETDADNRWYEIVNALAKSPNSGDTLFYRVRGIYRLDEKFWPECEFSVCETLIEPISLYAESCYRLWMGRNYILKILFYIPTRFRPAPDVEIISSHKEGAVVTPERIQILSRYNEERILIGCRRVLDRTLNPIWIRHANGEQGEAPENHTQRVQVQQAQREIPAAGATAKSQPAVIATHAQEYPDLRIVEGYLLTQVEAPPGMIVVLVIALAFASVLITMGPDMVTGLWKLFGRTIQPNDATLVASLCKTMGAILSLGVGYVAFRRLPIGK